ncbi:hypothetical protein B0H16DRAFT_410466 [Mycena metata]|uniref:Uncharacterized protein n=1 Tax=Mycena metata TaxID=1033252 RepID=A0AAD7HG97_9AGAR|nr:hypothetical protein B0H16DRAFT_410466 [Mycena metata]
MSCDWPPPSVFAFSATIPGPTALSPCSPSTHLTCAPPPARPSFYGSLFWPHTCASSARENRSRGHHVALTAQSSVPLHPFLLYASPRPTLADFAPVARVDERFVALPGRLNPKTPCRLICSSDPIHGLSVCFSRLAMSPALVRSGVYLPHIDVDVSVSLYAYDLSAADRALIWHRCIDARRLCGVLLNPYPAHHIYLVLSALLFPCVHRPLDRSAPGSPHPLIHPSPPFPPPTSPYHISHHEKYY